MKTISTGIVLGVLWLAIRSLYPIPLSLSLSGKTLSFDSYPPPETPTLPSETPNTPTQGTILYLPMIKKPRDRYYAQALKTEDFIYGVWATILTPDPDIRELYYSYASINIIAPDGKWIEAGVNKGIDTDCTPKFSWAIQPGDPTIVLSPLPTIGVSYDYKIEKVTDGLWHLDIAETSGYVIYTTYIANNGMNVGTQIQAVGEVNSITKLNDMGIADLMGLKWKMTNGNWSSWGWWVPGIIDFPPYLIDGISPDGSNNVRLSGNNGNPIPPYAPCS